MSTPNDGGPAFPVEHLVIQNGKQLTHPCNRMTLRDWFAGQALAGILAGSRTSNGIEWIPEEAYAYADAMLAARKGGQS